MRGGYSDLEDTPVYDFGHGLTYTRFSYGELEISISATNAPIEIALDVANTGERGGDEVVQLYVQDLVASTTRPLQQLAGFVRAHFEPGQTRRVPLLTTIRSSNASGGSTWLR